VSVPQTPADTATAESPVTTSEATSGDVLSPAPGTAEEAGGPPALPDADPTSDDAVVDPLDLDDDEDEDEDEDEDLDDETPGAAVAGGRDVTVARANGKSGPGDDLLVREGDVAGDYLERLLDILDVDGDIDLDVEGDRASVAIVGGRLNDLIGAEGATLEALQELTRLAVAQSTGVRSRLMLDVGGFRAKRRSDLTALAGEVARRVGSSNQPERLSPMNPFERKVVHDVIASVAGVHSESEGEEPHRRVVVLPDK
jgi:spoIIIJ-associated protein